MYLIIGHRDYALYCDDLDLQLCWRHAQEKPPVTTTEFTNLAEVIIGEEDLEKPTTPEEGRRIRDVL